METEKCMWKVSILESWIENRLWNHADMNERILTWLETSVRMAFFRPEVAFRIKMFQFDGLAIIFFFLHLFIFSFSHFSYYRIHYQESWSQTRGLWRSAWWEMHYGLLCSELLVSCVYCQKQKKSKRGKVPVSPPQIQLEKFHAGFRVVPIRAPPFLLLFFSACFLSFTCFVP